MKLTREVVKEPDVVITMTAEEAKELFDWLHSRDAKSTGNWPAALYNRLYTEFYR